jgi:hypothetical protein
MAPAQPSFITADRRGELNHAGEISYWTDWCRAVANDEKRAHLIDLRREHLIDQVCIQEILPPEK